MDKTLQGPGEPVASTSQVHPEMALPSRPNPQPHSAVDLDCPGCGGSGHIEDFRSRLKAAPAGFDERKTLIWNMGHAAALAERAQAAQPTGAVPVTVAAIAREIFRTFRPSNMVESDWNSGAVLGRGNATRNQYIAAAKAVKNLFATPAPEQEAAPGAIVVGSRPDITMSWLIEPALPVGTKLYRAICTLPGCIQPATHAGKCAHHYQQFPDVEDAMMLLDADRARRMGIERRQHQVVVATERREPGDRRAADTPNPGGAA